MKRKSFVYSALTLTIFSVIFTNCSKITGKQEFGNWYSCTEDGFYVEMLTKKNQYKFSAANKIVTPWCQYKISGDTLYQYDTDFIKDSVVVKTAKISYINNDEIELKYITSDETWRFYRMEQNISNLENDSALNLETCKRAKLLNCIDNQANPDSIQKMIYFQF